MTDDDKHAMREFLTGAGAVFGAFVIMIALFLAVVSLGASTKSSESSFKVVDTYKDCDVIRYTPSQVSEYKYFLKCPSK
jgi:hypothetical protein